MSEKKRYQIFLSSTFSDLEDERRKVMQALLELDCIPSGMEFFPASNEETFEFIKSVIEDADYYVLIISGRYGSLADDGFSFTEKEYDFAIESRIPVLSFVRKDITQIPVAKTDNDGGLAQKLNEFREKVTKSGRLCRMWDNPDELAGQVATTLSTAIRRYPRPGWIRGNRQPSDEILLEINELRKENIDLKKNVPVQRVEISKENLAGLDDKIKISYFVQWKSLDGKQSGAREFSYRNLLKLVGHHYRTFGPLKGIDDITGAINRANGSYRVTADFHQIRSIITQFEVLGLLESREVNSDTGSADLFYRLTTDGLAEYLNTMAHQKSV